MGIINSGIAKFLHNDLRKVVGLITQRTNLNVRLKLDFGNKNQTNTLKGSILSFSIVPNVGGKKKPSKKTMSSIMEKMASLNDDKRFPKNVMLEDGAKFIVTLSEQEKKELQKYIDKNTVKEEATSEESVSE